MTRRLDQVLCEEMKFTFSETQESSLNRLIKSKNSFFYCWCNSGEALDIVTVGNSADIFTLNLYRVSIIDLKLGVDLANSHPSFTGREALDFLKEYYSR